MAKTPVRRLIEKGIEAGADYIPDVIETPLRKAFSIDVPKAGMKVTPKAKPKPAQIAVTPKAKSKPPSLLSAVRAGGKTYTGPTHLDALDAIPDPKVRSQASLDANSRGFVNERGKYMDRFKAADYARNFDLFSPDAPEWARTAPEVISENLRLPEFAVVPSGQGVLSAAERAANLRAANPLLDLEGNPMRLYHGTGSDVKDFNAPAFLTPDVSGAEWYAMNRGDAPNIMPVYLGAKNVFDARDEQGMMRLIDAAKRAQIPVNVSRDDYGWSFESPRISEVSSYGGDNPLDLLYAPEMREQLQKEGFDVVRAWDPLSNAEIEAYVALQPNQIKSAIGNRGTYDPEDPDINMARGGLAVKPRKYTVKKSRK